ncbi:DNA-binding response regulator [Peptidiphaga gingivicola]|uniref:DNA-binding response regulator n=1 Tax=Peptidiphaga gingivicola TaxID=2741497 RepID=A0A179B3B0_9ACTO|nr:response regulator transcription factor [Peptidiphaga gingivicola]OAP86178.1 DNA-binding response regulator [Peptidiphaga gingivicola]
MTIRIVVADDQALVRGAIAMMLDLEEDIEVVAQAGNGREAIEAVACGDVDVVLADVEMPVMDGIAAASRIRKEHPDVKILMVTTFGRPGYLRRAMEAGASGFVVKDAPSDSLASAVRKVMAGQRVVDPDLAAESLAASSNPLTEREQDVLRATSGGGTTADVSRSLFLSQGTVRNYLSSAIHKTGARTRAEAVVIARDNGWL